MLITVYISQPDRHPDSMENRNRALEIMGRLHKMVAEAKVTVLQNRRPQPKSAFDDLANGLIMIEHADFVIFDEGWKNDRRCLVEDEVVVRYGKPYCRVDDLEDFFCRYITHAFDFTKNPAEADTDI